jgi:peroxiredoxin
MKIVNCIGLLILALIVISCTNENSYTLKGNIKGLQNSKIYVVLGDSLKLDSIQAKSGKFTYRGVSETVEPLLLYMEGGNVWITLWVQNGEKFSLTGNAKYPEMMMVTGGEVNKQISDFKKDNLSLFKERCELGDKIAARSKLSVNVNDTPLSSQLKNVDQVLKTKAQDFVEAYPSSIAALVLIHDYIMDFKNAAEIQPFLNLITGKAKSNHLYDKLNTLCGKDLQTKVGQQALDFKIKNTKNDTISLETFKNKYLILTFATAQCELCKPEYEELLEIRKAFSEKDLAILTISLDENKENWKALAQERRINWMQAIDSIGWELSEIASLYNVWTVPCNYLIDKNGVIVGSRLRVDSIQAILNEKLKVRS